MKIAINTSGLGKETNLSEFEKLGETVYFEELQREELFRLVSDCDAIIINKVVVDEALLSACPKLKYVGVFATGYNVVDISACNKRGITVTNVPGYSTNAVAQHVFALLLNFLGAIDKYTSSVAAGDWIKSKSFTYSVGPTYELYGKTFGIYGYGNIGKAVAKIADAFGAKVIICTRTQPQSCPYPLVSKDEIFKNSDILSLHCPQTPATANLINGHTLSLMKKSAVLINTARGGLVDESALAEALNGGKIAGACVDTVLAEPMKADNPLFTAKNCYITPHVAWTPVEAKARLVKIAAENLKAFLDGKPQNTVN